MRMVRDTVHGLGERPHYEAVELDRECEKILAKFFKCALKDIPLPIATDDLTKLIERDTSDFDPGADLSSYGPDVEGVTEFSPRAKPRVRISGDLTYDEQRENRYRTTLTHEYGHVHLHGYLFADPMPQSVGLQRRGNAIVQVCKRATMVDAARADWMEWQAGYFCGALLMPKSLMATLVHANLAAQKIQVLPKVETSQGRELIQHVRTTFRVSADAARVRLVQLSINAN